MIVYRLLLIHTTIIILSIHFANFHEITSGRALETTCYNLLYVNLIKNYLSLQKVVSGKPYLKNYDVHE